MKIWLCLFSIVFVYGCVLPNTKEALDEDLHDDEDLSTEALLKDQDALIQNISQNFVAPLTDQSFLPGNISKNMQKQLLDEYADHEGTSSDLANALTVIRLSEASEKNFQTSIFLYKKIMLRRMSLKPDASVPDQVWLDLAAIAIKFRKHGFALYLADRLLKSTSKQTQADGYNLLGVMHLHNEDIHTAKQFFKKSLDIMPKHEAAILNMGFLNLRFAQISPSQNLLNQLPTHWFAITGRLIIARINGHTDQVQHFCSSTLELHPHHKPTLFNCGLFYLQNQNNTEKSKDLIAKALSVRGGPAEWDKMGYALLESLKSTKD